MYLNIVPTTCTCIHPQYYVYILKALAVSDAVILYTQVMPSITPYISMAFTNNSTLLASKEALKHFHSTLISAVGAKWIVFPRWDSNGPYKAFSDCPVLPRCCHTLHYTPVGSATCHASFTLENSLRTTGRLLDHLTIVCILQ